MTSVNKMVLRTGYSSYISKQHPLGGNVGIPGKPEYISFYYLAGFFEREPALPQGQRSSRERLFMQPAIERAAGSSAFVLFLENQGNSFAATHPTVVVIYKTIPVYCEEVVKTIRMLGGGFLSELDKTDFGDRDIEEIKTALSHMS